MKILLAMVLLFMLPLPSHAARIALNGMESGSENPEFVTKSGTLSVVTTPKRSGGYALRVNPTTTSVGWARMGGHDATGQKGDYSAATAYFRWYWQYATLPASGSEPIFQAQQAGGPTKFTLRITSAGNLAAYDSAGTLQATGSTALSASTWYRIECKVATGASAAWEVLIDGVTEISGTANVGTGNNGRSAFGKVADVSGQSVDFYYDDISIDDAAYPGAGAILRLVPTANGSTMQWTAGTGSSNYLEVDDVPFAEASYIKNVATNDVALFALTDTGTAGITGTINAVRPLIYPRLDSTGTNATKLRLKSGATTDDLSTVATTTGGIYLSKVYATDPNTGAAWTLAAVDALEVGAVETTAVLSRLMDVHVYVEYTEAATSSSGSLMLMGVGR